MDRDRRKSPRHRCHVRCDVAFAGKTRPAVVRDVSAGGLSIQISGDPIHVPQGEPVRATLQPRGVRPFEIEGLAWHARTGQSRATGSGMTRLGLVLSEPCPQFVDLLESLDSSSERRAASNDSVPESGQPDPALDETPVLADPSARPAKSSPRPRPLPQYAVRLKQVGGPRTVRVVVAASSAEQAKKEALSEAGEGWTVLEAALARAR